MKYNTVLFDLDGTLLDTLSDLTAAVNHVLSHFSFPLKTRDEVRSLIGKGLYMLVKDTMPPETDEETIKSGVKLFSAYYTENLLNETKPYKGIEKLVADLKANGINVGVVTNKGNANAQTLINAFFSDTIEFTLGPTAFEQRKPSSYMIDAAMAHFNTEKDKVLYVGDSEVDINTGFNCGIDCLSVSYGFRTREQLFELGASHIADTAENIFEFVMSSGGKKQMKYIINGKIVLKDHVITGKVLEYDTKITGIIDESKVPAGAEIIDAKGAYVAPGLIDIHIHGYMGEDASDGSAEGIRVMAEGIVKNGVTGWLPTTMTVSVAELRKAFTTIKSLMEESKTWNGATILGINAEGPYINPSKKGAQAEQHILAPTPELLKEYSDIIKIATIAPDMDKDFECIRTLRKETDIVVSMGHTDASFEVACDAIENGVGHVTHLFNAQTALAHRKPGVVGAALTRPVTTELICDTFHVHKGLFQLVADVKKDKLCLITDCTRGGGMPDGEYELGGQKIFVNGIECLLADGTIAGSVLKLNEAVRNVLANTSLSVFEVVNAASLTPATVIGVSDRKGSLEIGKDADIIIADEQFNIQKTIIGGTVRYE